MLLSNMISQSLVEKAVGGKSPMSSNTQEHTNTSNIVLVRDLTNFNTILHILFSYLDDYI